MLEKRVTARCALAVLLGTAVGCGDEKGPRTGAMFDPSLPDTTDAAGQGAERDAGATDELGEEDAGETEDGGAAEADAGDDGTRVLIPFLGTVDEQPVRCGQRYTGVGVSRSEIELRDFRIYVHDVALIDAAGKATPVTLDDDAAFQMRYRKADGSEGGLALLDFTNADTDLCAHLATAATHTLVSGTAPKGDYERIAFTIGVPEELNHLNGASSPAPLNAYGMQWTWASGYRHVKIDVQASTGTKTKEAYYFHPGAAGCTSDSGDISGPYVCENPLTSRVELPFRQASQAIQADLGRFFAAVDLASGLGCMGTATLLDFAGDGPGVQPKTGCAEMWASLGLALPSALTSTPETLGRCATTATTSCRADTDCPSGESCTGYVAAKPAEAPRALQQTMFSAVAYDRELAGSSLRPAVDALSVESPFGWPHPDYTRDAELEVSDVSTARGTRSHPPDDARYGANCTSCHEDGGPGPGRYAVAGTIWAPGDGVYTEGGVVQIGTGVANRFGPTVHPIADKIRNFQPLFELPIDGYGQFFATADQAPLLDFAKQGYFARIIGTRGTCKTDLGRVVPDGAGAPVTCASDADCSALRYVAPGRCLDAGGAPILVRGAARTCSAAADCAVPGATCEGTIADRVPVCDKLLNAMAADTVGSCNFCHGSGFKIYSVQTIGAR
jgi:uncharacterized repeat protein (TIGR04052 family)